MKMDFSQAQADMRLAYCSGAVGMFVSALAWAAAAITALQVSPKQAVWVLFIGGMLIHPLSVLLEKLIGRTGQHSKGNPLGGLAAASTFWLIFNLPLAYTVSLLRIEWFFPAMLLVIGGRYLVFASVYGMRTYWVCGLALALAGWLLGMLATAPAVSAMTGALIEAAFAGAVFVIDQREQRVARASAAPE